MIVDDGVEDRRPLVYYYQRSAAYIFGDSLADEHAQATLEALRGPPGG